MKSALIVLLFLPTLVLADCKTKLEALRPWAIGRMQYNSSIGNRDFFRQFTEDFNRIQDLNSTIALIKQAEVKKGEQFENFASAFTDRDIAAKFILEEFNENGFFCQEKGYSNGYYLIRQLYECLNDLKAGKKDCAFGMPRSDFYPRTCAERSCEGYRDSQ